MHEHSPRATDHDNHSPPQPAGTSLTPIQPQQSRAGQLRDPTLIVDEEAETRFAEQPEDLPLSPDRHRIDHQQVPGLVQAQPSLLPIPILPRSLTARGETDRGSSRSAYRSSCGDDRVHTGGRAAVCRHSTLSITSSRFPTTPNHPPGGMLAAIQQGQVNAVRDSCNWRTTRRSPSRLRPNGCTATRWSG